jgi:hypothetical protein
METQRPQSNSEQIKARLEVSQHQLQTIPQHGTGTEMEEKAWK